MIRTIALASLLAVAACATRSPGQTDQVSGVQAEDKAVAVSCVPSDYQVRPLTPSRAQLAAADGPAQFDLLGQYYAVTDPWAIEAAKVIDACRKAAPHGR